MDKIRSIFRTVSAWMGRHRVALIIVTSIIVPLFLFHLWLHITNPYASWNIVQLPYTTTVKGGVISYSKQFTMHVYSGNIAQALGYYKSGFLIVQNAYFGSRPAPSTSPDDIIADIHALRFDPAEPYLISGDQFSVLYPRNLGVFYNTLLDPHTALNQHDWEDRQRIYLQSFLYALDAFSAEKTLTTTIVPIGPRSVALTEVHPGSVPSDTLYGMLYALAAMQHDDASDTPYVLGTRAAAQQITTDRRADLQTLLDIYLRQVQDPATGLVKRGVDLASARDGVVRDSSFYDNVVLWKTLQLANQLDIKTTNSDVLDHMRTTILSQYWDETQGHFNDDRADHGQAANYSSDWLITLPTGFLDPAKPDDQQYLTRSVSFIRDQHIAEPFPIKYQAVSTVNDAPWAVRTFVPNYGGDAIWSYWGAQYITLLADLAHTTGAQQYHDEAARAIQTYRQKIIENHGFPETFTSQGEFLQNAVYKSIRQTGWVVQFEHAEYQNQEKTTTTE